MCKLLVNRILCRGENIIFGFGRSPRRNVVDGVKVAFRFNAFTEKESA